jgi:hypothetical protein
VIAERGKTPLSCSECGAECDDTHSREGWEGTCDEQGWITWRTEDFYCPECWESAEIKMLLDRLDLSLCDCRVCQEFRQEVER